MGGDSIFKFIHHVPVISLHTCVSVNFPFEHSLFIAICLASVRLNFLSVPFFIQYFSIDVVVVFIMIVVVVGGIVVATELVVVTVEVVVVVVGKFKLVRKIPIKIPITRKIKANGII